MTQAVTWGLVALLCFWMCSRVSFCWFAPFFPVPFLDSVSEAREPGRDLRASLGERAGHESGHKIWLNVNYYSGVCLLLRASFQRHAQLWVGGRHARKTRIWKSSRGTGDHSKRLSNEEAMNWRWCSGVSAPFYRRLTALLNSICKEPPCFIIKGPLWIRCFSNKLS